jgi:hypothetical protein
VLNPEVIDGDDVSMANHSVARTVTAQLTAATVDQVTLTDYFEAVEVVNLDGAAEIYILVDGTTNPTVGGDNCNVIPAAMGSIILPTDPDASSVVRLISSGTPRYHVRGV